VQEDKNPIANPLIVLREEFDDWAILFDPENGNAFGLNPMGVLVWKRLDGHHSIQDIVKELKDTCEGVPKEAEKHLKILIKDLVEKGLAGYKTRD
jgi:SynChlorMet cassette protein ScmD